MATLEDEGISRTDLIEKSKRIISELLAITHPIVIQVPIGKSAFLRVMETSYRRAYHTLAAIHRLSDDNILGSSASILTRSMLEDSVSIEYMLATDKEVKAQRFKDFYFVQAKEDNEYIKEQGLTDHPDIKESVAEIDKEYERVKADFKLSDGRYMRSWDGKDVDGMLRDIKKIKPKLFSKEQIKTISRAYLMGNRKAHFNPIDLMIYFDEDAIKASYEQSMVEALLVALGMYIRLTTRYIDEISANAGKNTYHVIAKRTRELLEEMDNN